MLYKNAVFLAWALVVSSLAVGCMHPVAGTLTVLPNKALVLQNREGQSRNVASGPATLTLWNWNDTHATVRLTDANQENFELQVPRSATPQGEGTIALDPRVVSQPTGFAGTYREQLISILAEEGLYVCAGFGWCRQGDERGNRFHFDCPGLQRRRVTVRMMKTVLEGAFTAHRSGDTVVESVADYSAQSEPYEDRSESQELSRCRVI